MYIRKNICVALVLLLLMGALSSCGGSIGNGDGVSVVTTVFPVYDWAQEIIGERADNVKLTMLLDDGVDLHNYQPTTEDIVKVSSCDVFIYVGGESDSWVESIIKTADNEDMIVIDLMECMEKTLEEAVHHHEDDGHQHEHTHTLDEHIWLSLRNAVEACGIIGDALIKADAEGKDVYEKNLAEYTDKLEALDARYADIFDGKQNKTVVFTDRFPFTYLCHDYGIDYCAAFDGCSTDTAASPEVIKKLADKIDELSLGYVLTIEGSELMDFTNTVIGTTAARNAKILTVNSLQAVTAADVKDGVDYFSVMENNLAVFAEALN